MITHLCLDPGLKYTGVAISYEGELSQPHTTIVSRDISHLIRQLRQLISQLSPLEIIIGQPEQGSLHAFSAQIKVMLQDHFSGLITLYPEDNTSKDANHLLITTKTSKVKRDSVLHQVAAALILQDYLDNI